MVTLRAAIDWFATKFFVEKEGVILDSFEIPHPEEDGGDDAYPKWKKEEIEAIINLTAKYSISFFVTPSDVWQGEGLIPTEEGINQMKAWSEK